MANYLDNMDVIDANNNPTNVLLQDRGTLALANQLRVDVNNLITNTALDIVTPEMFGAVGDGATDDTRAFLAAIDSGKIILLNNSYLVTDDLVLVNDLIGNANNLLDLEDCQLTPSDGVNICGINFTGGYNTVTTRGTIYITPDTKDVIIEKCTFKNMKGMAIGADRAYHCIIRDSIFDVVGTINKQVAIWINGLSPDTKHNHIVSNCIFNDIYLDGIGIYNAGYITVTDCKLVNIGNHPPYTNAIGACGIFVGDASHYSVITNNNIDTCSEGGITVSDFSFGLIEDNIVTECGLSGITFLGSNIICNGNRCTQCGNAETGDQYGINARSLARSVITNNVCSVISGTKQLYGIGVGTDANGISDSNVITGNNLRYNGNVGISFPNGDTDSLYNNLNVI